MEPPFPLGPRTSCPLRAAGPRCLKLASVLLRPEESAMPLATSPRAAEPPIIRSHAQTRLYRIVSDVGANCRQVSLIANIAIMVIRHPEGARSAE
jgi:hypothetical protein